MFRKLLLSVLGLLTLGASAAENLQTWNGVARANIQTINGVAIANVESWNGVDNTSAAACSGNYGSTTAGANNVVGASNFTYYLKKISIACTGTATGVFAYVLDSDSSGREVKLVVYNDSGGTPSTLVAQSAAVFGFDPGWSTDAAFLPTIATPGTYWIGFLKESSATDARRDGEAATDEAWAWAESDFTPDADVSGNGSLNAWDLSIYISF